MNAPIDTTYRELLEEQLKFFKALNEGRVNLEAANGQAFRVRVYPEPRSRT